MQDYLNFKKKFSPGLVPNPRMFNENDLEMHFMFFIEDLKNSNFKLKQEKDSMKKVEYIFEIPNTITISNKATNFQSSSNSVGRLRSSHGLFILMQILIVNESFKDVYIFMIKFIPRFV